jgi:hypothetical protein
MINNGRRIDQRSTMAQKGAGSYNVGENLAHNLPLG